METPSLFEKPLSSPLAYRMAPKDFDKWVGQSHILGEGKPLRQLIEQDRLVSIILWGPPGCGKTSLSRLISKKTAAHYVALNAVTAKIADIKTTVDEARSHRKFGKKTILFIDEIHRFNKTQQDALLPEVESGLLTLIGATTENPFFSVIPALLSRSKIFELHPLPPDELGHIMNNVLDKFPTNRVLFDTTEIRTYLLNQSQGDARKLLNNLELLTNLATTFSEPLTLDMIEDICQTHGIGYSDDQHYDFISAFIKSMRGSDPDAAIYWLARLLKSGEDPVFIARRLIVFASEDIGNADPMAFVIATALIEACKFIGMPEIEINLGHVTTYLATAPKSNASYIAIKNAGRLLDAGTLYPVPPHLKDSHYKGAKKLGYGDGYIYPHDQPHNLVNQPYMPGNHLFYSPKQSGHEKTIKARLDQIKKYKEGLPPV